MIHVCNIKGVAWQYFAKFNFVTEQIIREICENKATQNFPGIRYFHRKVSTSRLISPCYITIFNPITCIH